MSLHPLAYVGNNVRILRLLLHIALIEDGGIVTITFRYMSPGHISTQIAGSSGHWDFELEQRYFLNPVTIF